MASHDEFTHLLQILSSEQQISQRTDQKALHLLSALGVVLVFFLVHFNKIPPTPLTFGIIVCYLIMAFGTLGALCLVIVPRLRNLDFYTDPKKIIKNPAFFGGISQFDTQEEYEAKLHEVLGNPEMVFHIFADSIFAVGKINAFKNVWVRRGMVSFLVALALELTLVVVVYFSMTFG
jgi:uncharacterized membrane protein